MNDFDLNRRAKVIAEPEETLVEVDTLRKAKTPTSFWRTPAERLAAAQRRVREHRTTAPGSNEAFQGEDYYKDFVGVDTGEHWWDVLHALVSLIHVPRHFSMGLISYDRQTGEGIALEGGKRVRVPIAELKAAVIARIAELGLAEYLLWEYLDEPHTVAEDSGFYAAPFDRRIARFKEQATESL